MFTTPKSTDGIALMRTTVCLFLILLLNVFLKYILPNKNDLVDGAPVYHPNSFNGPAELATAKESVWSTTGEVTRYNTNDDSNYDQPAAFWEKAI